LTIHAAHLLDAGSDVAGCATERLLGLLKYPPLEVILVSNEVGSGVVPPYPAGREYRDLLGEINQRVAAVAKNVILMVAGLPLVLKGKSEIQQ
jgi:adenosylcobinamide kinase/adenosylcobinamide-phosphate guanylyltransferase